MNLDRVEEDMAAEYSEEEEDDILHIGNKSKTTTLKIYIISKKKEMGLGF